MQNSRYLRNKQAVTKCQPLTNRVLKMMKKVLLTLGLLVSTSLVHAAPAVFECEVLAQKLVDQLVEEGLLLSAEQYQQYARKLTITECIQLQKSTQPPEPDVKQPVQQQSAPEVGPANKGSRRPR